MAIYVIRPNFTVIIASGTYTGGDSVDLTPEEFEANKHKLEGVESDTPDLDLGYGNGNGECCFPEPYLSKVSPDRLFVDFDAQITIEGSFFTPDLTVEIDGVTVNSVEFISSNKATVNVTVGSSAQFSNITIDNGKEVVLENAIELLDPADSIIDLRLNGTPFGSSAIETRSNMSWTRTAQGLRFDGQNPWGSWARLVGDSDAWVWNRSQKRTLSLIFTNSSSFMLGIGSRATNPTNSQQFYQAEIVGYFNSSSSFSRFYGNRGTPGQGINDGQSANLGTNNASIKKITFENNGEAGALVSIYELPSANPADWMDTGNLKHSLVVSNNFTADEPEIMPFIIPRSGASTLFLGMILI